MSLIGRATAAASSAAARIPAGESSASRAAWASPARRGVGPTAPSAIRQRRPPAGASDLYPATDMIELSPNFVLPSLLKTPRAAEGDGGKIKSVRNSPRPSALHERVTGDLVHGACRADNQAAIRGRAHLAQPRQHLQVRH